MEKRYGDTQNHKEKFSRRVEGGNKDRKKINWNLSKKQNTKAPGESRGSTKSQKKRKFVG